jgi:glycine dehydrogenase subunit 2
VEDKTLIYEKSVPGRVGFSLPELNRDENETLEAIPAPFRRTVEAALPEVSEGEVLRHFVALSVKNHHIDRGFYPLGSCTMKYNPKANEAAAALPGFRQLHPLAPDGSVPGIMQIMYDLEPFLREVSGFPGMSLQPVAGAQGEFVGLLVMRAYHEKRGDAARKTIIIPDSAHGTNPASVAAVGYRTVEIKSNGEGVISPDAVSEVMDDTVAGLMMTNPNTLGLFEKHVKEIADIVHAGGGLMYMDGANLNAHMGIFRPADVGFDIMHFNLHKTFSTPHGGGGPGAGAVGCTADLEKFLPVPVTSERENGEFFFDYNRPDSVGRVHAYHGNVGNMIRAYAYIMSLGGEGLKGVSENAVLNANYLKTLVRDDYDVPYDVPCMHEFVISGNRQKKLGVRTLDISKRILDFGMHSPTNYFPLIVPEAMMIEPTETEARETLDEFARVMKQIAREVETDPEMVKSAPHSTPVRRLDEITAARSLDVVYTESD